MSDKGFTLLETVIYIALLAFLMGVGITAAFYIIDSGQKNKTDVNIQAEESFILRKIEWALTGASNVTVSATTLSVTKPSLPPAQNPLVFSLNGTDLQLARGAGAALALNSADVVITAVSGIIFTDIPASGGKPEAVTVNFMINGKSFTLTKYLRN